LARDIYHRIPDHRVALCISDKRVCMLGAEELPEKQQINSDLPFSQHGSQTMVSDVHPLHRNIDLGLGPHYLHSGDDESLSISHKETEVSDRPIASRFAIHRHLSDNKEWP
jgi:hypothetical protein